MARRGHRPLLDARLGEPELVPEGYATGAAKGLTTADLPDHAYWEQWFPAEWVSEMREQIRLWFYSQLSCRSRSPADRRFSAGPGYTRRCWTSRRETRLVGEHDRGRGRLRAHGGRTSSAGSTRPQPPDRNPPLRLRACSRDPAKLLVELLVPRRRREHRRLAPESGDLGVGPGKSWNCSTAGSWNGCRRARRARPRRVRGAG